jgi:tetratricopeptide (TPR) repeat protein
MLLLMLLTAGALTAGPRAQAPVTAAPDPATPVTLEALERAVTADPENLRVAADYRQLAIAGTRFDRSIDFFKKLANRRGSGPNIKISLALAYVDKVPTSGDMSRLFLGRDAVGALDKSIAQRPNPLAYYIRGLINLYYNNFIFKRIPRGLEDLRRALALSTPETPPALVARTYVSLGDGQWRLDRRQEAREAWQSGAELFPSHPALQSRLASDEMVVGRIVSGALYAGNRVDTSLRDIVP